MNKTTITLSPQSSHPGWGVGDILRLSFSGGVRDIGVVTWVDPGSNIITYRPARIHERIVFWLRELRRAFREAASAFVDVMKGCA